MSDQEPLAPAIVRGRIEELRIFDVTEAELDVLERGAPDSLFLNLAIFFASVAATFIAALLVTEVKSDRAFDAVVIVIAVFSVAAATLFGLWRRSRVTMHTVSARIRERIPPQGERITDERP